MTCLICKEPVLFEQCGCGGPYERALRTVTGAIMEGEACAVLEHAARRWLGSHGDDDLDALEGALAQWIAERSRFNG